MAINTSNRRQKAESGSRGSVCHLSSPYTRGFTLLVAIIFMSVMLSFGLALGTLAYKQAVLASSAIQSQYAFYAADAGLECALYADQKEDLFAYTPDLEAPVPLMTCDAAAPISVSVILHTADQRVISSRLSLDSGKRCADITVYKPSSEGATYVFSVGYDVSCETVANPSGARLSSRGLRAHYASGSTVLPPSNFSPDSGGTLASGLVGYWKLDEGSGVRADQIGGNNFSSVNGVSSALGVKAGAAQFVKADGTYLTAPDSPELSMGPGVSFTVSAWVYHIAGGSGAGIVTKATGTGSQTAEYALWLDTGSRVAFYLADGTNHTVLNSAAISPDTWHFVVASYDAVTNQMAISIDNGTPDTATNTTGSYDSVAALQIGTWSTTAAHVFTGRVDEVGIWKRVLTSQERNDLYNNGNANTYAP